MRYVEITEYGAPDRLQLRSRTDGLVPGSRQVLVEVKAASYNPVDTELRKGTFDPISARSFPQSQGQDWSGIVIAVGEESPSGRSAMKSTVANRLRKFMTTAPGRRR